MPLKAVLFDFNGVILDDEPIHAALIDEILLQENLRPQRGEYDQFCLGRSDRTCLDNLLSRRGRAVSAEYLDKLIRQKATAYEAWLCKSDPLPFFAGALPLLQQLQAAGLKIAIVTGALHSEVSLALERGGITVDGIISAEAVSHGKPSPEPYQQAVAHLQTRFPEIALEASHCLAIEDTFAGIDAAKAAGIKVVGVAHTYPFHMLQRRCHWVLDRLEQFDLEGICAVFERVGC
ncbi:HAD family phosphatase [Thermosynechococcaceae cyanobacterium Okahandja]